MNEVEFEAGDRIRVVRDTVSLYGNTVPKGTEGTVNEVRVDGYTIIRDLTNTGRGFGLMRAIETVDLELVVEETIEVGDVVKATNSSGSIVQGVITGVPRKSWVQIDGVPGTLYGSGWSFEIVSKAVKPIEVGSVIGGDRLNELPQDAVVRDTTSSSIFLVDRYEEVLVNTYGTRAFARSRDREYRVEYLPTSKKSA